jgi:hypothetical protein
MSNSKPAKIRGYTLKDDEYILVAIGNTKINIKFEGYYYVFRNGIVFFFA